MWARLVETLAVLSVYVVYFGGLITLTCLLIGLIDLVTPIVARDIERRRWRQARRERLTAQRTR